MNYAFMGKILRVNLTHRVINEEEIPLNWMRKYLGGAGLATKYLFEEIPQGIDEFDPSNLLIFMTGLLTGTASASASRYSVVAKSPLTGLWGHANSGGSFGPALKWSGYDGIIFEGISPAPVYLRVFDGQAELCDAVHLWGKTVPDTENLIHDETNKSWIIASIGPAGENKVRYAAIMNNTHRAAGRSGMGAVMGSKRLKAIACAGHQSIELANPGGFNQAAKRQYEYMNDSLLKIGFDTFGTNMVADMVNVRGGYPTLNWQKGTFEDIDEVNAQAITDKVLVEGVRCFACPIACGRETKIREGKWLGDQGEGPEYETTNTLGALCGISDLNAITKANYLCNEYGLDTISTGSTIAFAMECLERGLLTIDQIGGRTIRFGDSDTVVDLIPMIAKREGVGDLLAEGSAIMSEKIGQGSEHFAMHVKGLELPAYDPRAAKITGLGYVTANRGGDHMTGYVQGPTFIDIPFLIVDESSIKDPLIADPREVQVLVDLENALTVFDSIGGCKFMGVLLTANDIVDLISTATGWNFSVDEFRISGERIYNLIRAYCVREGLTRDQDKLPNRLLEDPLQDGPAQGMILEHNTIELLKDTYYKIRGWDRRTGIPTPEKLRKLDLSDLIEEIPLKIIGEPQ